MIPKVVYMTHESYDIIERKPKLLNCVKSWKKHKDIAHVFHDKTMREQFIKDNFDDSVYEAYNKFPMGVMKADLWRYCVIYIHGGIYADTDTELLCNPNDLIDDEAQLVIAPEPGCNFFCQWTFAAPAKSPILKEIIDLCVYRTLNTEIKGEHIIHFLTGPAVFTDAINAYLKKKEMKVFGKCADFKNYPSKVLKVIPSDVFHRSMIRHHYAGDQGWKKERKGILF